MKNKLDLQFDFFEVNGDQCVEVRLLDRTDIEPLSFKLMPGVTHEEWMMTFGNKVADLINQQCGLVLEFEPPQRVNEA